MSVKKTGSVYKNGRAALTGAVRIAWVSCWFSTFGTRGRDTVWDRVSADEVAISNPERGFMSEVLNKDQAHLRGHVE